MKRKVSVLVMLLVLLGLAGEALAQRIPDQIAEQQARINSGVVRGDLTRHEAGTLQANLNYIRGEYERALANGSLRYERRRIMKLLDRNSHMIYAKRHNAIRSLY